MRGGPDAPWPTVARVAALAKFALLAFVIGTLLAGSVCAAMVRSERTPSEGRG